MFARFATLVNPIMDNVFLDVFYFFVPNRLVWTNWQRFNGETQDPYNPVEPTPDLMLPVVDTGLTPLAELSIYDYFGLPTGVTPASTDYAIKPSALPFRAYNLIWNEWFRDQNLQNSVSVPTGDTSDAVSTYKLLKRGKRHDYFTSCLPWPQKGKPVAISLTGDIPVVGNNIQPHVNFESFIDDPVRVVDLQHATHTGAIVTGKLIATGLPF